MQTYLATDIDDISIPELVWNELVAKNETNTIYQTHQWFKSWWKVFEDEHELFFIYVMQENDLVGIAPMMISTDPKNKRILTFVGENNADYSDFVTNGSKEIILRKIFEKIFSSKDQWDSILLNNLPEYSSTPEITRKICTSYRYKMRSDADTRCPTLLITGHETNAQKVANKKGLRRRHNYFRRNGALSFRNVRDIGEAKNYLSAFFDQHVKRWALKNESSLFLNDKYKRFYTELLENTLHTGWLLFSVLEYNRHPIAFHYGFDYNSTVIWYKPSFDVSYYRRSPGTVLLKYLIEYSLEHEKNELDFTVGDEPFKNRFANKKRRNTQIKIYGQTRQFISDFPRQFARRCLRLLLDRTRRTRDFA
jgi:CelD/BcsL family acetyltransferase involved in cellulose biosynthesis